MRRSSLLLAALLLCTGGLFVLGFRAVGAEEDRARLRAQAQLAAGRLSLSAQATSFLARADRAADAWSPSDGEPHALLASIFVATPEGDVRLPFLQRFPAATAPAETDADAVRLHLREAERQWSDSGDPLTAVAFLEPALGDFAHPDLTGALLAATAGHYERAGRADRARFLYEELIGKLPGARGLEGRPLAPECHHRLLALLPEAGRTASLRELAFRLADDAWDLPPREREERLAALALPEEARERATLVDGLRYGLFPVAVPLLSHSTPEGWNHVVVAIRGRTEIFGWRPLALAEGLYIFGYRLAPGEFTAFLAGAAKDFAGECGARVELFTAPPVEEGPVPEAGAIRLSTDLGGELRELALHLALPPPSGLAGLRVLHLGMTALLAAVLIAGALLSLRAVRKEVEAARLRQRFIDSISHELRTPLTSIRMYAEMLHEETGLGEEEQTRYLTWIHRESERLSRLVDDVLDFSRLERGDSRLHAEPVAPEEIAAAACELAAPLAEEGGFTVRVDLPPDLPLVRADRDGAVRVLLNLLTNAIRYSGESREVGIEGSVEGDAVMLVAWDRGPGVPEEERERIFDRFYRAPRDARAAPGVGLGLVLAREIARALGGDVLLLSSSGEGSRFGFRLPAERGGGE